MCVDGILFVLIGVVNFWTGCADSFTENVGLLSSPMLERSTSDDCDGLAVTQRHFALDDSGRGRPLVTDGFWGDMAFKISR